MNMADSKNQLMNELIAAWNSHDIDRALKFYATDYAGEDVGRTQHHQGHAGARDFIGEYLKAFPDIELAADEIIEEGARAALMWTARGTHRGAIMNIPPTNRPVNIRGVSLFTIQGNKVHRATYIWDVAGLLRNIGLLPDLNS
jgi:steroid delta-isomerase-like uncharacterized protein